MGTYNNNNNKNQEEHEDVDETPLPGFRFHPTDDELVGFYLRRKVEKKPISIELIKAIDIYKYEPWDLPKATTNSGDKEWYFFCKRGRKYKNSIRPNRVTGSGFWKATGIDKPVHSQGGEGYRCIGLKKTLVYYRGSAGKGTKTDWMMHEFRLPTGLDANTNRPNAKTADPQEAEIWTLCRIFKRNMSYRKYTPDWRELSAKRQPMDALITSKKCNMNDDQYSNRNNGESYIDFSAPIIYHEDKKPVILNHHHHHINVGNGITNNNNNQLHVGQALSSSMAAATQYHHPSYLNSLSSFSSYEDIENELFMHADWDELRSAVDQFVVGPTLL
ncbi:transcription factor JUNGBRUNNEN 1 [Ziziphus jujuba]|uniref:Transcription factor JUNGBRUNNEN 1 n=2 Tax=Ziziphus jujuba TaxID=326968 RepID=A0A6P4A8J2_ZIZJJ|nr:transcription factor JUNGBRUNNEN 1 [Ziziphus jujuba]KAH7528154.1 hypothetical protein FEM48_Zijuj05G0041700 [Ziziphus jujuba var. spinosa]